MFFLDLLMGKGQPRKLHDLSCQFGTKGFTKEMKAIAGGSKTGLKKFLAQYPFLFTIEEDQVRSTSHSTPSHQLTLTAGGDYRQVRQITSQSPSSINIKTLLPTPLCNSANLHRIVTCVTCASGSITESPSLFSVYIVMRLRLGRLISIIIPLPALFT